MSGESMTVYKAWRDVTISYTAKTCVGEGRQKKCTSEKRTYTETADSSFSLSKDAAREQVNRRVAFLKTWQQFSVGPTRDSQIKMELGAMHVFSPIIDESIWDVYCLTNGKVFPIHHIVD